MRILLIRHGETVWSPSARLQGETDVPLSETGRAQARALAKALETGPADALVASPLARASETARIIADGASSRLEVCLDPRLREIGFGAWEGLTPAELKERSPSGLEAWMRDLDAVPPGGEPRRDSDGRLSSFARELAQSSLGTVLIVGHLLAFQTLICALMGMRPVCRWPFHLYTGSLSEIRIDENGASLISLNRLSHLEAAGLSTESLKDR